MALAHRPTAPNTPPVRQPDYSAEQVRDALTKARGLVSVAARYLDCHPSTVRRYIANYPTVAAALKEAREGILDMAEARLFEKANEGEQWAVMGILKNLGKDRGYVERIEQDHRGEVTIKGYQQVSPDDWDRTTTED